MNLERMKKLRDAVSKTVKINPHNGEAPHVNNFFNMNWWSFVVQNSDGTHCKTPACMAGWAVHLAEQEKYETHKTFTPRIAAEWLGVDYFWALKTLFEPYDAVGAASYRDITVEQAVACLDRVIAHVEAGGDEMELTCRKAWGKE